MKHFKPIFTTIACFIFFVSCTKNNNSSIPLVAVDLYYNLNNPEFVHLKVDNGWTYVSGGSRGIIIYRTNGQYKAFDRHCPYDPSSSCGLVSVDVTNITGKDDCCGSKFLLANGQVTQGPANQSLKQYSTSFDGTTLHIFN